MKTAVNTSYIPLQDKVFHHGPSASKREVLKEGSSPSLNLMKGTLLVCIQATVTAEHLSMSTLCAPKYGILSTAHADLWFHGWLYFQEHRQISGLEGEPVLEIVILWSDEINSEIKGGWGTIWPGSLEIYMLTEVGHLWQHMPLQAHKERNWCTLMQMNQPELGIDCHQFFQRVPSFRVEPWPSCPWIIYLILLSSMSPALQV